MNKADELHMQGLLFGADDADLEEHGQVEEDEQPYEDVGEGVCEEAWAEDAAEQEAEQELEAEQAQLCRPRRLLQKSQGLTRSR
eukprot:5441061-Amphidinium_carterae.1